jgi:DNA polymerase
VVIIFSFNTGKIMNSSDLKSHLELCRRLGIRYISTGGASVQETETSPAPEASLDEKPLSPAPSFISSGAESDIPPWLTASAETEEAKSLTAFDREICGCQKCPLGKTRKKFVFGSGNPQARVMFVGEAPGADEDAQGLPFVGRAGQPLTKIIESTQTFKRQDVFICNVLKCRPPGNRTPLPEEVEQCRPYLEEQIRVVKPWLIMALGASAAQALLRTQTAVGKLRNQWHDLGGIPLRVTYHPAALLRFEGYKKDVWADMKELTAKFQEISQNQK